MAKRPEGERIKPCLNCDELIPFTIQTGPFCNSPQQAPPKARTCPSCSAKIDPSVLFCPKCGKLTVATAGTPVTGASEAPPRPASKRYFELSIWATELAALILMVYMIADYLLI